MVFVSVMSSTISGPDLEDKLGDKTECWRPNSGLGSGDS